MGKPLDLMGRKFDYLTVVEKAPPDRWGKTMWVCDCRCGNRITVRGSSLTQGITTSCGCKKEHNLAGQHIGFLEVLERSDRFGSRGKRKTRLWKCRCDCGAITYKATDTLANKETSMCQECAAKYGASKARANAGYVEGTQVSKIANITGESNNLSGVRGVYLNRKTGKYRATIKFQGKTYHLGTFTNLPAAAAARKAAEDKYFGSFLSEHTVQLQKPEE